MARTSALFVSAPSSGSGKTLFSAGLACWARRRGKRVRAFKTGPDFLDPMVLERATGAPVYQLDPWMTGLEEARFLLSEAAREADLILIEGMMGLYDGQPSSADLARELGIPIALLIDAGAMAATFGALAQGLRDYGPARVTTIFANRVAGAAHASMLEQSLPEGIAFGGWLPRDDQLALPSRHLGLVRAGEIRDLDDTLEAVGSHFSPQILDTANEIELPLESDPFAAHGALLAGRRIAVARDAAFDFIYQANLRLLRVLGAEILFCSPLADAELPAADALWLPGGYPELHGQELEKNRPFLESLRLFAREGKPIYAECGGMLYLADELRGTGGQSYALAALLPAKARMKTSLSALGMQWINLPQGVFRGHSFHYSDLSCGLPPAGETAGVNRPTPVEQIYRKGSITATYAHSYFPSNPKGTALLFDP